MQRRGWMIAGWATATVLAVLLGLQGVRTVSDSVTDARRAPLSPSSVRAALHSTSSDSSESDSTTTTTEAVAASSSSEGVVTPTSTTGSGEGNEPAPADSVPPASSSDDDGDNEGPGSSNETGAPIDETYQVIGGTVSVRFEDNSAHLLWASPAPGFELDNNSGGSDVDIRFQSDDHESRVRAFWDDGPRHEIEEKAD